MFRRSRAEALRAARRVERWSPTPLSFFVTPESVHTCFDDFTGIENAELEKLPSGGGRLETSRAGENCQLQELGAYFEMAALGRHKVDLETDQGVVNHEIDHASAIGETAGFTHR